MDDAKGTRLMVTIKDNGAGISPERMSYIHQELGKLDTHRDDIYRDMERYTSSPELFGLRNVKIRLKMIYGNQAELLIDSEEHVGTTVKIFIPVHLEGERKET
ncbi:Histidine kinase-, DNA gyrase B-, and HSP90-like ATPase [compost metagenome]